VEFFSIRLLEIAVKMVFSGGGGSLLQCVFPGFNDLAPIFIYVCADDATILSPHTKIKEKTDELLKTDILKLY